MFELVMLLGFLYVGLAHLLPDDNRESAGENEKETAAGKFREENERSGGMEGMISALANHRWSQYQTFKDFRWDGRAEQVSLHQKAVVR